MALNHRLKRLEASAPKPPTACAYCGFTSLKDGAGTVYPGRIVPESFEHEGGPMMLGCKTCCAWVRVESLSERNTSGGYEVAGAEKADWPPDYA